MGTITLHANPVGTFGCPVITLGDAATDDPARSILVNQDFDYPGIAGTFGWSPRMVDVRGRSIPTADDPGGSAIGACDHDGTDGTITCPSCGLVAYEFIMSARDWIDSHDGATADDPGYFARD